MIKLTKAEISHLLTSLGTARQNGVRDSEGFVTYLDGENGYFLTRARELERKSKSESIRPGIRRQYAKIAKRCRKAARFSRRIRTKIIENRKQQ